MSDFDDVELEVEAERERRRRVFEMAGMVERRATVDQVIIELNRRGDHRKVFQFGGKAMVMVRADSTHLTVKGGVEKIRRSVPREANGGLLSGPIEMVCEWQRTNADGERVPKMLPEWVLKHIKEIAGEGLLPLAGVADFPVIAQDKRLLCGHTGYDSVTALFIDCKPISMDGNPFKTPQEAYKFLREEWLGEFSFASEQDAARCIAIPLTLLSRRTRISGGSPIPFITAPTPNTGKTLLARALVEAITDAPLPVSAWDSKEDERRKMMLAVALENPAAVLFDNIPNGWEIRDGTLDKYITSDEYKDRLLGKNINATAPATTLPIFTGNNIIAGSHDLISRSYVIRMEKPTKRIAFRRVDLLRWTGKNRKKIIHALMTIATHRRQPSWEPVSRFPAWAEYVGGPLQFASGHKDLFGEWDVDDSQTWDDDLEGLCTAMAAPAWRAENARGFTPAEMSENFSVHIAKVDPTATAGVMWDQSGAIRDNAKVPPKKLQSILGKFNGHPAGDNRFRIGKGPHPVKRTRIVNLYRADPIDEPLPK